MDSPQPASWSSIIERSAPGRTGACQERSGHNLGGLCIFYLKNQVKIWRKAVSILAGTAVSLSVSETYQARWIFRGKKESEVWNWASMGMLLATLYFTIIIDVKRNIYSAQTSHYHVAFCYFENLSKKIFLLVIHNKSAILIFITKKDRVCQ